jgi:hypothetical protein
MKMFFALEISAEPEKIFPWIDNPEKAMRWQKGVKKGKIIEERPEKVGTTFIEEMGKGAKILEMKGVITDYVKNKVIVFHLESKLHKVNVSYSLEGKNGKTILKTEADIHWKFPMNLVNIIFGRKIRKDIQEQMETEFEELKRLCEQENNQTTK